MRLSLATLLKKKKKEPSYCDHCPKTERSLQTQSLPPQSKKQSLHAGRVGVMVRVPVRVAE